MTERARMMLWGGLALPVLGIIVWLSMHVKDLGFRMDEVLPPYITSQLEIDYVMGLLWWCVFAFCLLAFGGESRRLLLLGWIGKLFIALGAMLFYENLYGLDGLSYFLLVLTGEHDFFPGHDFRNDMIFDLVSDATVLKGNIGHANTLRFMLMVATVTGPYYHAMKILCAFFGFLGSWWFYRAVVLALGRPCPPMFFLLVFFPSITFWTTMLGKDPIQFFFLGLYVYGGTAWFMHERLSALWVAGIGLLGSYIMRPWQAFITGGVFVLAAFAGKLRAGQAMLLLAAVTPPLLFAGNNILTNFGLQGILADSGALALQEMITEMIQKKAAGYAFETQRYGGSGVDFGGNLDPGTDMIITPSLPLVIFSGLFRPLPFDINHPLTALAAAENTMFLGLTVVALFRLRLSYLRDPLVVWPALYCLAWAALYGIFVMANFGVGVRYKLQMWPFALLLLTALLHKQGRAWLDERVANRR
ncbi:MAG: hypothetical protein FJ245_09890 [Nitrospira sp.]|nr:hypothetical protein [Nitrospira sp.]